MGVVFFQAEDGIRDAQESRGLGDVYKRQTEETAKAYASNRSNVGRGIDAIKSARGEKTTDLDKLEVDRSYGNNIGKQWI